MAKAAKAPPVEIGARYGKWVALELVAGTRLTGMVCCRCACGREAEVWAQTLRFGTSRGCMFCRRRKFNDLTGRRFGRLIAIERIVAESAGPYKVRKWRCRCDCGAETTATGSALERGVRISCGCTRRRASKSVAKGAVAALAALAPDRQQCPSDNPWWLCRVTRRDDPDDPGIEDLTQAADAMAAQRVMQADMGGRYRVEILRQAYVPDLQRFLGV